MQHQDKYGGSWQCSSKQTISAWESAIDCYLDYSGTPVADIQLINDPAFLAGPVFCAAMKLLGGVSPDDPNLAQQLSDLRSVTVHGLEGEHTDAVVLLAQGQPTAAALVWDRILKERPGDILAHKCAHETWFLIGEAWSMRRSSAAALEALTQEHPCFATACGHHAFSLEETGDYYQAERLGRLSLEIAPTNCWALHCLTHVFETKNRHQDSLALLNENKTIWQHQNLLSAHIWWHLSLRLIEAGQNEDALAVFDDTLAHTPASNPFRLTDGTSLLWRLELAGVSVGNRWKAVADKWSETAQRHTNAFLDMHAALAFAQCPDHKAASLYFESLDAAFDDSTTELSKIYRAVTKPLAQAMRKFPKDKAAAAIEIAPLLPNLYHVGGSIIQREIVERSFTSALIATNQPSAAIDYIDPKLKRHPHTPWMLRDRASALELTGDKTQATLLRRKANASFTDTRPN